MKHPIDFIAEILGDMEYRWIPYSSLWWRLWTPRIARGDRYHEGAFVGYVLDDDDEVTYDEDGVPDLSGLSRIDIRRLLAITPIRRVYKKLPWIDVVPITRPVEQMTEEELTARKRFVMEATFDAYEGGKALYPRRVLEDIERQLDVAAERLARKRGPTLSEEDEGEEGEENGPGKQKRPKQKRRERYNPLVRLVNLRARLRTRLLAYCKAPQTVFISYPGFDDVTTHVSVWAPGAEMSKIVYFNDSSASSLDNENDDNDSDHNDNPNDSTPNDNSHNTNDSADASDNGNEITAHGNDNNGVQDENNGIDNNDVNNNDGNNIDIDNNDNDNTTSTSGNDNAVSNEIDNEENNDTSSSSSSDAESDDTNDEDSSPTLRLGTVSYRPGRTQVEFRSLQELVMPDPANTDEQFVPDSWLPSIGFQPIVVRKWPYGVLGMHDAMDGVPQLGLEGMREAVERGKATIEAGLAWKRLRESVLGEGGSENAGTNSVFQGVDKIVFFYAEGLSDDIVEYSQRGLFLFSLALCLRDLITDLKNNAQPETTPPIYMPAYDLFRRWNSAELALLIENNITLLDSNARLFLTVDATTAVISYRHWNPVKQIIADLARPAILICRPVGVDNPDSQDDRERDFAWYEQTPEEQAERGGPLPVVRSRVVDDGWSIRAMDPDSPRVRKMVEGGYERLEMPVLPGVVETVEGVEGEERDGREEKEKVCLYLRREGASTKVPYW